MGVKVQGALLWLLLIGCAYVGWSAVPQAYSLVTLQNFAAAEPVLASVVFSSVLFFVAVLCLPGSGPLSILAGAVFGLWWGVVLVSFSSALGATFAVALTRKWLQEWVRKKLQKHADKVLNGLDRDGDWYLFSLRLMPVVPFFLVNLIFGVTRLSLMRFYVVTQLGMLAGIFVYVNAGTQLQNLNTERWADVLSVNMVASLALLAVFPWLVRGLAAKTGALFFHGANRNE